MTNRKYLLGLFSIFYITTIFAGRDRILWDFGLVIITPVQKRAPEKNINSLSDSKIETSSQIGALISNPFIPPTLFSLDNKVSDAPILLESLAEISPNDILQIKLLASRLTLNNNYQPIINIISKIDSDKLKENDFLDLNYWLANAFFHTGKYIEAENVIFTNMELAMDERLYFLLAMIYEAQGRIKEAQDEYFKFIKQFPKSDFKVTALIKSRMLGRH